MLQELNQGIAFIEANLTHELSPKTVAAHIGVSDYHLRTVFFYLAGMTLSEYIKNRRLSEANRALLLGRKVTDVAYEYGYQSIDGFTRAFKKWSGFLPSDAVKKKVQKTFPKLSFVITVKGGNSMECRIEEKPAFYLAGVARRVPMQFEGVNDAILELAKSITQEQRQAMHALKNMEPFEIVNASYDADAGFLQEEGDLTHLIGVLTTEETVDNCLVKVPINACTWAVFPNEGPFPETLQETMGNIYGVWLPTSGYEVLDLPTFSFTKMDAQKADYAYSEVWTPVKRK
ncbi:AraC family transcriptional regulator [Eubacteriales bacterium OttesenSCG-928-M02]|nr:AraC family transcriptional regulator [Eubacteriales bacterium OttesenSCG-928-M02]